MEDLVYKIKYKYYFLLSRITKNQDNFKSLTYFRKGMMYANLSKCYNKIKVVENIGKIVALQKYGENLTVDEILKDWRGKFGEKDIEWVNMYIEYFIKKGVL